MEVTESKKRGDLFEEVICQLDSAAGEVRETGPESVAEFIEGTLIPFVEGERTAAALDEAWSD